jgi:hypothetical protein
MDSFREQVSRVNAKSEKLIEMLGDKKVIKKQRNSFYFFKEVPTNSDAQITSFVPLVIPGNLFTSSRSSSSDILSMIILVLDHCKTKTRDAIRKLLRSFVIFITQKFINQYTIDNGK